MISKDEILLSLCFGAAMTLIYTAVFWAFHREMPW